MNEELIEELYRNWISNNPNSEILFREFKSICKSINDKCIVEDRKNASVICRWESPEYLSLQNNLKMPETIVIRERNPRMILIVEEE